MSDSLSVIIWWLTIFTIGSIFLPLSFYFFHKFADRGYIFSKVIGILLSSYFIWLLGSLKFLPFTKLSLVVILLGATLINLWVLKNIIKKGLIKLPLGLFILEEIIFFLALSFWSYVRAAEPSIRGLEKFMDFGFVNSILRGQFFPPLDMWLTQSPDYNGGFFINYYYFGHYITAFLTKLSGIDSAVTYNLMLATLFAFTLTLSFSIGMNLYYLFLSEKRKAKSEKLITSPPSPLLIGEGKGEVYKSIIVGLLAAFIVAFAGNLHPLYVFTQGYPNEVPKPPWELSFGFYPERYWYPNATRFIPYTIHEFPIYSFVVADLHGHVSDIPFVFLTIALLLHLIVSRSSVRHLGNLSNLKKFLTEFEDHTSIPFPHIALLGLLLGVMYMTNAWDGLIYMILAGLVFLYINLQNVILATRQLPGSQRDSGQILARPGTARMTLFTALYKTFSATLFLLFFFLVASLPFSLNFKPFVSGIGVLCAPAFLLGKKIGPFLFEAGKCQKSPFWMLAILWGFFYFNVIGYLVFVILPRIKFSQQRHPEPRLNRGEGSSERSERKYAAFRPRFFAPLRMTKWPARLFGKILELPSIDIFILLLILISTLLLIFPEFFYIKDIYPAHYRANTMFKLGYQAFMMLGLASAYIFSRLTSKQLFQKTRKTQNVSTIVFQKFRESDSLIHRFSDRLSFLSIPRLFRIWKLGFVVLFLLVGIYPYFAINSYYGGLKVYRGLDGLNWLTAQYPDDYKGVLWLRQNIQCNNVAMYQCNNQPVIVEAQGDSYTDYARVSANTGLPTIVGWPVHEWLWRGSYDEAGKRIPQVQAIYESKDEKQTRDILRKYNAQYIFLGALEREKYKQLDEKKLESLGKVVFESGKTKIIKITSISS